MQGKSLFAAFLIVVLAALSGGVWLLGNSYQHSAAGYGFMHEDGDALVVNFGNTLVWLDREGREQKSLDLSQLGIVLAGDFEFFSNGDLLVYHRQFKPDLAFNLRRYLRLQVRENFTSRAGEGFYRCNLADLSCAPFARELPRLDSSFRVVIGADDSVYLAHTGAFRLYKISAEGEIAARSNDTEFRFPNQLLVVDDQLWVVDTNHQRIAQVSTNTADFASVKNEIPAAIDGLHRFPHQLAHNLDSAERWVVVGDHAMAHGRILHLGRSGEKLGVVEVNAGADPMAIYFWQGAVWLTDFAEPLLQRFDSRQGQWRSLASPQSAALGELAAASRAQKHAGEQLSRIGVGLFVVVLLGGFIAAWKLEKQQTLDVLDASNSERLQRRVAVEAAPLPCGQVLWLKNNIVERLRWLRWANLGVIALILMALVPLLFGDKAMPTKFYGLLALLGVFIAAVMIACNWLAQQLAKQKLGVIGQSLILERADRRTVVPLAEVKYNERYLLADEVLIALGNPMQSFFDFTELNRYVFPRLKSARRLQGGEHWKLMWQQREPMLMVTVAMAFVAVILVLALQLFF